MVSDSKQKNNPFQVMPDQTPERRAELKADIEANGILVPVAYNDRGEVIDGYTREEIAKELGITDYPRTVYYGLTDHECRQMARRLNLNRRHISREQEAILRGEMIHEALFHDPGKSDRQIAGEVGCSPTTVGKARKQMVERGELTTVDSSRGADGKTYTRDRRQVSTVDTSWIKQGAHPTVPEVPSAEQWLLNPALAQQFLDVDPVAFFLPPKISEEYQYVGLIEGAHAKLILIGAAAIDVPAFFIELLGWNGDDLHWDDELSVRIPDQPDEPICINSNRAMVPHALGLFLSGVDEMEGAQQVVWGRRPATPGEMGNPLMPSYSRWADDDWLKRIEEKHTAAEATA